MIAVRTSTLCIIAASLDEAIDKLDPLNAAFPALMEARALYRHHVMKAIPDQQIHADDTPMCYEAAEPGYAVDAAGTFVG